MRPGADHQDGLPPATVSIGPVYFGGGGRVSMPEAVIHRCISSASAWEAKPMSLQPLSCFHPAHEYQRSGLPPIRSASAFHSASSADLNGYSRLRRATKGKALALRVWLFGLRWTITVSGGRGPTPPPPGSVSADS